MPRPRTVREQLVPRGQSARTGRTVRQTRSGQKCLANWIKTKALKKTRRTRRTPDELLHADRPPARVAVQTREQQPEPETETTKFPTRPWIFQTVVALEKRFGEDVKRPSDAVPQNMGPQTT
jgi:hypothetical protein